MNHSDTNEFFSRQLMMIDENIKELTNLYISSTPIQERKKHFFSLYVMEVEELLKSKKKAFTNLPKVFIGTKVTVEYDEDGDTEDYFICFPEQSNPDMGFISFLSPVGRQLLLKKIGEQISISIPSGELRVTIKEISFVGQQIENEQRIKEA